MADMKALQLDLLKLVKIQDEGYNRNLAKQKELCEKLNNNEYDAVVRELFTRDDIIKYLSSTGIAVAKPVEKDSLTKAVQKAVFAFQKEVIREVINLKDEESVKEIKDILSKHVKFDEEGCSTDDSDPLVVNYIKDFAEKNGGYKTLSTSTNVDSMCITTKITSTYRGVEANMETKIDTPAFNSFMAEHFLVKDLDEGVASFELNY